MRRSFVPVGPEDFPPPASPERASLAGVAFQKAWEQAAFVAGGGAFVVPASRLEDFLAGRCGADLPDNRSCPRSAPADLSTVLPPFVQDTLRAAVGEMLRRLRHVDPAEAVVYAAEMRSSSPVRVVRDEAGESVSTRGLFPAGEGAGYAGGIVSSGVDGVRAGEAVLARFAGR